MRIPVIFEELANRARDFEPVTVGLPVERDLHFKAKYRLTTYADQAREAGRIVA